MKLKRIISEQSNKGMSLVELIVSVLILSMVTGIIMFFVMSSTKSYNIVYNEVTMQTEADIAVNYIDQIAVEAKAYVKENFTNSSGVACKALCILAPGKAEETEDYYYIIWHEANNDSDNSNNKLRFCKFKKEPAMGEMDPITWKDGKASVDGISAIDINATLENNNYFGNIDNFLARYVTDFSVVVPDDLSVFPMLQINLSLKYADSSYTAAKNIASRNLSYN